MTLQDNLAGCKTAHERLVAAIAGLTDAQARAATALPGWTVGHVLSHLARNAEANAGVVEAARRGEVGAMYPSMEQRDAAIEEGSGRPAAELVADVTATISALEAAWAATPAEVWSTGLGRGPMGEFGLETTVWGRWREASFHLGDLGPVFGASALSDAYLQADLPRLLTDLVGRLDADSRRGLGAWLLGRSEDPGALSAG